MTKKIPEFPRKITREFATFLTRKNLTFQIDHFNFVENGYFKQRYLINDTYWDKTRSGPIFFYTGNEGDIEAFAQNSGFMWDSAPLFSALLVFAEHRYYGTSLPFGNDSLTPDPKFNGYLTSEQALADYAELLTFLKATMKGAEKSPVIGNFQHKGKLFYQCGKTFYY